MKKMPLQHFLKKLLCLLFLIFATAIVSFGQQFDQPIDGCNLNAPTVSSRTLCSSGVSTTLTASVASGKTAKWYDTSWRLLYTGLSYRTPNLYSTTRYYVNTYDSYTGCESLSYATATVTVAPISNPTASSKQLCAAVATTTLTATPGSGGNTCRWYSSSTSTSVLATGTSYNVSGSTNATYYVSSYNTTNYCESGRVAVTVSVITVPAPTVGNSPARIGSGSVSINLSGMPTSGGPYSYRIFTASSGGTLLASSSSSPVSVHITASTTLYAEIYNTVGLCAGPRSAITVTVYPAPVISYTGDPKIESGDSKQLSVQSIYDSYQWKLNGINLTEAGATTASFGATKEGSYTVTVSNAGAGSTTSAPATLSLAILSSQNLNYIESNTILEADKRDPNQIKSLSIGQRSQNIQYFDGLGRPMQIVSTQASPQRKDLVQPIAYDDYGREAVKFLPYASNSSSGFYKPKALNGVKNPATSPTAYQQSEQYRFYDPSSTVNQNIAKDINPYAVTVFEPSPLNRVVEQGAPGAAWQPNAIRTFTNDHTIEMKWRSNTSSGDRVYQWNYVATGETFGSISSNSYYLDNQLYVTETRDEHQNKVREFKDKLGQVVLKEVEESSTSWLRTYYIYDDFGNLRAVLPPRFSQELQQPGTTTPASHSFSATHAGFKELCFWYHYDGRKRMVEKHVPGAGVVYMIYDYWDRLVLTQDEEQRGSSSSSRKWLYTKYDQLNRPIITGTWIDPRSRPDLQRDVTDTTQAAIVARFELRDNSQTHGYTLASSYPAKVTAAEVFSATYYDEYGFKFRAEDAAGKYAFVPRAGFPAGTAAHVKGQVTGSKVKILNSSNYLQTLTYYDDKYRPIQIVADNQLGGIDRSTTLYNFPGWAMQSLLEHSDGKVTTTTLAKNVYDHTGRLIDTWQKTSSGGASVAWKDIIGVNVGEDHSLTKTAAAGYGNAGAASKDRLAANEDGWVEMEISSLTDRVLFGLSANNLDAGYTTIDYAFFTYPADRFLRVYEKGTQRKMGSTVYNVGDKLRVERKQGKVYYYHNSILFYTSTITSQASLLVDVTLYDKGNKIQKITASFAQNQHAPVLLARNHYNELGELVEKKLHGTLPAEKLQKPLWKDVVGGEFTSGNSFRKTAPVGWDNSGFVSVDKLAPGQSGWVQIIASETDTERMIGLSATNPNAHYNSLGYAWYLNDDNATLHIYENGTYRGHHGSYQTGDVLKVERLGDKILYKKNEQLIYTSTVLSTGELMVDASLYQQGATLSGISFSFASQNMQDSQEPKFLQTVDMRYNIRGWLSRMNNAALTEARPTDTRWKDLFGFELFYNEVDAQLNNTGQFNGNISAMRWSSDWGLNLGEQQRAYRYTYDRLNRITRGDYLVQGNTTGLNDRFSTSYGYDANGNIMRLSRQGRTGQDLYGNIDVLEYKYYNGASNKLLSVNDTGHATEGFKDGAKLTDEYFYDDNGNMIADKNKGIEKILYNHLNLPEFIRMSNGDMISYTYDAAGIKLRQEVTKGQEPVKRTEYVGGMVYVDGELQFMQHPEGRILFKQPSAITGVTTTKEGTKTLLEYQYNLKDHLGNVRLSFTSRPATDVYLATMESERKATEEGHFLDMDLSRAPVGTILLDHTHTTAYPIGTQGEVSRLNGYRNERQGPRKTLRVLPGDTIRAQVWAKYVNLTSNSGLSLDVILGALAGTISGYTVTIESSGATRIVEDLTGASALISPLDDSSQPLAYLSWYLFDDSRKISLDKGHDAVSAAAAISKTTGAGEGEMLQVEIIVKQPGYLNLELDMKGKDGRVAETRNIDVYFDDFQISHHHSPIIQTDDYYPFGLTFNSYQREGSLENRFKYNGKEEQEEWGVIDYGARMYDPTLGRWHVVDGASELYMGWSPYTYALNTPTNAIDPDGNLVIFINGNHFGDGGSPDYWRSYSKFAVFSRQPSQWMDRGEMRYEQRLVAAFDVAVMKQFNDNNARYYDGSVGGFAPSPDNDRTFAGFRYWEGYKQGKKDAAALISSLAKDKNGVITESIKIITHSMGGVYGKGFVKALKEYIRNSKDPNVSKVLISLVADFDPFQAGSSWGSSDPEIYTQQLWHDGGFFGMADQQQKGSDDDNGGSGGTQHSIFSYFNDISRLQEGTYEWDDQNQAWKCTSCK